MSLQLTTSFSFLGFIHHLAANIYSIPLQQQSFTYTDEPETLGTSTRRYQTNDRKITSTSASISTKQV